MTDLERRIVLLRHAKSDRTDAVPDIQRPLAERGRQDAPVAGQWLRKHVPEIDLVLCSPATRVRQTWDLVAAELDAAPEERDDQRLYAASAEDLLAVVRQLHDHLQTVLFVGHNPGLEDLVALLTGVTKQLKTCGVAVLVGSGTWEDADPGWANLETLATPRAA